MNEGLRTHWWLRDGVRHAISGWKSTGNWYGIPGSDEWYTQSWLITDAQFVGKWGYHFAFDSDAAQNSKYVIQSVTVTKP